MNLAQCAGGFPGRGDGFRGRDLGVGGFRGHWRVQPEGGGVKSRPLVSDLAVTCFSGPADLSLPVGNAPGGFDTQY